MTFDVSKKYYTLNVNPMYPMREYFCTNLTGLQEYNNYTITVSAVNAAGTGPESTPITFLTKQAGMIMHCILHNDNLVIKMHYC